MPLQNRLKLIAVLFACAFVFATCSKKWDEHNAITDPLVGNNLYQNISKNTGLTKFSDYQVKTGYDKVLIPGDPEREMESIRMKEGIPLVASVVDDLKEVGKKFSIQF